MSIIDKNLVYMLAENSRISIKKLSSLLKKSPQRLKYNITAIENEGIITSPYCIFDYSLFSLILFRVYFKGGYIAEDDKNSVLERLKHNPFVTTIYEMTGEFDLVVELISPNPSKFNKELKKISMMIPSMPDYKVILNIVSYIYPRDYLLTKRELKIHNIHSIVGGDREHVMLNKNELLIIKSILSKPKGRLTELAKGSGLNIKTAKAIIESLEQRKIIKGYKYVLDTSRLGLNKCRLFVKLHNLSKKREDELMKLMQETEDIVQINKTIALSTKLYFIVKSSSTHKKSC